VKGVQFDEVFTLDETAFASQDVDKIYGLIFLFKWQQEADPRPTVDAMDHGIFFAQQVIQNACATQAILSVLMNVESNKVDLGSHLKDFKEFTAALDPQMKGMAIENSEVVRVAHNSFRHQSSFEIVQEKDEKGDAFHFVGYVCHEGKVYELDGLKPGPILIGEVPAGTPWVETARQEIQRRIQTYEKKQAEKPDEGAELRFNLMSIVADRKLEVEQQMLREKYIKQRANVLLVSHDVEVELDGEDLDDDDAPADIPSFEDLSEKPLDEVKTLVATCTAKIAELQPSVAAEQKKREQWKKENNLRRHDLVPLALCALRHLARKKELMPAFEKGKAEHLKRVAEKNAAKAS